MPSDQFDLDDVSLFSSINTSLSGLNAASAQLETSAHNLANLNTEGYKAQVTRLTDTADFSGAAVANTYTDETESVPEGSNVDPAREVVNMIQAKSMYTANAVAVSIADQMMGTLLDVVADDRTDKDRR